MELAEFVEVALLAVSKGVHNVNTSLGEKYFTLGCGNGDYITFDVEVHAEEAQTGGISGKLNILKVSLGGEAKKNNMEGLKHRMQFKVKSPNVSYFKALDKGIHDE